MTAQPGILESLPPLARYLGFQLRPDADLRSARDQLAQIAPGKHLVIGLGPSLVHALGGQVDGLRPFPSLGGCPLTIPATPTALWVWLRGEDRGALLHVTRELASSLGDSLQLTSVADSFLHDGGRDLSGYEDGTENPTGDDAIAAGVVRASGDGLDGGSFVAVQRWVHDLDRFQSFPQEVRDNIIGRRHSDNEELDDAPASAHVKRTAQEDFDPEAFVVRRSMPWASEREHGLMFVAFGRSFDAFEAQLKRMVGLDDGVIDGLFRFTQPASGAYYWCPPVHDGHLDLRAIKASG